MSSMRSVLFPCVMCALVACATTPVTPNRATPAPASGAAMPMFKGVELYSWMDPATRTWRFALLPGTNRNKTTAEVLAAPEVAHSPDALKARIDAMAEGEQVAWLRRDEAGFPVPSQVTVAEVVTYAAHRGVNVQVVAR